MKKIDVRGFQPNIVWLDFESRYWMNSSLMRIQEFYESPLPTIQGQYFTHEELQDAYAELNNWTMSYFTDWGGFNFPGAVLLDFLAKFPDLSPKEQAVRDLIRENCDISKPFYVIATSRFVRQDRSTKIVETIFKHELAHALYSLDPQYKTAMLIALQDVPQVCKDAMRVYLMDSGGYGEEVIPDEMQAMLTENCSREEFIYEYGIDPPGNRELFQNLFRETLYKYQID